MPETISRDTMLAPMLSACPSFLPEWETFLRDWKDEPGELPLYLALADLVRHLTRKLVAGDTSQFPRVFDVIELWHTHGDHSVREMATIGVLEQLQNGNQWPDRDAADYALFEPWLGPQSRRYWQKVIDFWERGVLISDD